MAHSQASHSPLSDLAMTYSQNFFLHVVCEGKSERNYLAALNRLLRDSGIGLTLLSPTPKKRDEDGGGHFRNVVQKYKDFRRNNRNVQPWIWVDWDLYLRNDQHCMELYESRPKGIPAFLFSIHNFEDFLVLHSSTERVLEWVNICRECNHFASPMHSEEYMPLFKSQFPEYKKGELPDSLAMLSNEQVENALIHSLDASIPFRCDFIEKLAEFIMARYPDAGRPWNIVYKDL